MKADDFYTDLLLRNWGLELLQLGGSCVCLKANGLCWRTDLRHKMFKDRGFGFSGRAGFSLEEQGFVSLHKALEFIHVIYRVNMHLQGWW